MGGEEMPMNTTTPVCGDDEELLQLQFIVKENVDGDPEYSGDLTSYRIYTESTNITHDECIMCQNDFPVSNVQLCLPRDECHSVMVFKWARNIGCTSNGIHELLVRWG